MNISFHNRIFVRFLLLLIICAMTGAHWVVLQGAAWTSMVIAYSQDSTLEQGLVKTFNGENPCTMCLAISEARDASGSERDQGLTRTMDELRWTALTPPVTQTRLPLYDLFAHFANEPEGFSRDLNPPPTPPPRFV